MFWVLCLYWPRLQMWIGVEAIVLHFSHKDISMTWQFLSGSQHLEWRSFSSMCSRWIQMTSFKCLNTGEYSKAKVSTLSLFMIFTDLCRCWRTRHKCPLRAEITKTVSNGLCMFLIFFFWHRPDAITGQKTLPMLYINYDVDICHRHQVELSGWPNHVPFTSSSHITTGTALQAVQDALKSGICHWVPLSWESKELLTQHIELGDVLKKSHAPRADKGMKCGPHRTIGKENRPPHKAQSDIIRSLPPHSAEVIDD